MPISSREIIRRLETDGWRAHYRQPPSF